MSQPHQYWLPGYGLSRSIVLSNIHIFLGPTASVRPFTYQGRDGYLVTGTTLTQKQIQDLKNMSEKFELDQTVKAIQSSCSFDEPKDNVLSDLYINKPVPVNPRGHDHVRDRERDRERGQGQYHFDRSQRSSRYR